ncbi:hypothetical protein HUW63_08435 [Myxococcus sp. AM001]|nr:hypothetical protein [Myxococcus sp. AM001]
MSAHRPEEVPQPRRSLLPAEFTLKFRRLDEAGESWEVDYGAGTVIDEDWGALQHAFQKALVEVRRVADAGRESQAQDAAPGQAARKTGGAR